MSDLPSAVGSRTEHDALGAVDVPADALYGVHTVRGIENFRVSGVAVRDRPALIAALGHVKAAAARANCGGGVLDTTLAGAIVGAAREVARGEHNDEFPVDLAQGGGGTVINMNANEVIANRAAELLGGQRGRYDLVHPNDHVNRSQSTNDVIPTALALATVSAGRETLGQMAILERSLPEKAEEVGGLTAARTHLPPGCGAVDGRRKARLAGARRRAHGRSARGRT